MRVNRYIALSTGVGRRAADKLVVTGRVKINGTSATIGADVIPKDKVTIDGILVSIPAKTQTIMLNKPVGYVCSRDGQGSKTIYELLPENLHNLKPVGRLDKDSSGLLLLTNDGELANKLTHPSFEKVKVYDVAIDKSLTNSDERKLKQGVMVEGYISHLHLQKLTTDKYQIPNSHFLVSLTEGKNRQIRRTFSILGYNVTKLYRTKFGKYILGELKNGKYILTSG